MATRTCRVVPDVIALDRDFDYSVPDDLGSEVQVGTIVRVPLHGRRVKGWVVADGVESNTPSGKLLSLIGVVSEGPPAEVVALAAWAARRYAGSRVRLLRSASPPNRVPVGDAAGARARRKVRLPTVAGPDGDVEGLAADAAAAAALAQQRAVVRWPPLLDRRRLVSGLTPVEGSTIVVTGDGARADVLVRWLTRCGREAVLLRGDDPAAARTAAWSRARGGGVTVVGGRLAALAPVPDLRAAVVVDDADEVLKEERTPAWHARDVLVERSGRAGAPFVIVSAAPTLASIAVAGAPVLIPRGVEVAGWPRVDIVDRRAEPPGSGLFSERLAEAIRSSKASLAVCVLNRRGRARLLACGKCGHLVRRDRAGAIVRGLPADGGGGGVAVEGVIGGESSGRVCPRCGAIALRVLRSGVTRVREELAALLPHTEVAEVDASTVEIPSAELLVGTEAVLHRAEVRRRRPALVAYLDFDQELLAPRFGAGEQALWLLIRGARLLAGRPRSESCLLVQTRLPEHRVLEAAAAADPGRLVESEEAVRRAAGLPPFAALAVLSGEEAAVSAAVAALSRQDAAGRAVSIVGQTGGGAAARALVRSPDGESLAGALADALPAGREVGRLRCEVDPLRA